MGATLPDMPLYQAAFAAVPAFWRDELERDSHGKV